MFLGNPLLPINIPVNEALDSVKKILIKKNWNKFEVGTAKLILIPFVHFNYHYFLEEEQKIKKSVDGDLTFNLNSLKIEDITKIIKENNKKLEKNLSGLEFSELDEKVNKKNLNDLLKVKTAEFFKIPKENILISSTKKYFFPVYEIFITINEKTHKIKINAVLGEVMGVLDVPEREKGFLELTNEVLEELSSPKGWLKYSKEILKKVGDAGVRKRKKVKKKEVGFDLSFLSNKWVLILIILLALFLIFIAFY